MIIYAKLKSFCEKPHFWKLFFANIRYGQFINYFFTKFRWYEIRMKDEFSIPHNFKKWFLKKEFSFFAWAFRFWSYYHQSKLQIVTDPEDDLIRVIKFLQSFLLLFYMEDSSTFSCQILSIWNNYSQNWTFSETVNVRFSWILPNIIFSRINQFCEVKQHKNNIKIMVWTAWYGFYWIEYTPIISKHVHIHAHTIISK